MNIVNHTSFEVETIPFKGISGKHYLTVIVKGTFSVSADGDVTIADEQLPISFGDVPYDKGDTGLVQFEADIAPFKPRADIILIGHAYAPKGKTVQGIDISLRVDNMQHVLRVFGDRTWNCPPVMPTYYTAPEPFEKIPLTYDRSFGGCDENSGSFCQENLAGKGFHKKISKKCVHQQPLPNIEDPKNTIKSPKDCPRPVGFGFYGRTWHPRASYLGTYDENWRTTRSPDLPEDFKYDYYNAAHPDLQWDGFLKGSEQIELMNLAEDLSTWQFSLPDVQLNCEINKSSEMLTAYLETLEEDPDIAEDYLSRNPGDEATVPMNLDTLCLMPDEKSFFLVWRGRIEVFDLTAIEVAEIIIS